jgi:hypothetical protein
MFPYDERATIGEAATTPLFTPSTPYKYRFQVPNMFPYDERATIGEAVRALSKKMGRALDTPQV